MARIGLTQILLFYGKGAVLGQMISFPMNRVESIGYPFRKK